MAAMSHARPCARPHARPGVACGAFAGLFRSSVSPAAGGSARSPPQLYRLEEVLPSRAIGRLATRVACQIGARAGAPCSSSAFATSTVVPALVSRGR